MDCTMVAAAPVLPAGYVVSASRIADRRMILAGYRLADLLTRFLGNYGSQINAPIFRIFADAVDSSEQPGRKSNFERPASKHRRTSTLNPPKSYR
jgi:hypothetical protein